VYGFALEKGREDGLLDLINSGLQDLCDSGRYDELFEQYFVTIE
jgi:ABC-type amino acid transport substrate-binding protein